MTFDGMTAKELRTLKDRIDAMIVRKQMEAKADLAAKFATMADEAGLDLAEVIGGKVKRRYNRKPLRDRKTGIVWSGAGRLPKGFERARAVPA